MVIAAKFCAMENVSNHINLRSDIIKRVDADMHQPFLLYNHFKVYFIKLTVPWSALIPVKVTTGVFLTFSDC